MASTSIVWLRNDLRIADNPALSAAVGAADTTIAVYIHETDTSLRAPGAAVRWWLHNSLSGLGAALAAHGIRLIVLQGKAIDLLPDLLREHGATSVFWNRRYAPGERDVDAAIKQRIRQEGITATSFPGNVLIEPWDIATGQGKPYSVFTPFWKTLRGTDIARPIGPPERRTPLEPEGFDTDYKAPAWSHKLAEHWSIGETAAQEALTAFLDERVSVYRDGRDFPARESTSRLSPYLRVGEISARQVWHAAQSLSHAEPELQEAVDKFLSELAWRDFSYHQLYHRADIAAVPMSPKYSTMSWRDAPEQLAAWQQGHTGLPIIDAGMRELWATGSMHNRVRMLTASLLTKNLLIDWRVGERWFWDCLVDADMASNPASWQWVAGCGLDAAPYFRIFNPVTQGERFDADGDYVRRWVPELAGLPAAWIHKPAEAPRDVLASAGVVIGTNYPAPIVDLKATRVRALEAAAQL